MFRIAALLVFLLGLPTATARAADLLMYEQPGCEWCEIWNAQIAPIYPKTAEGKRAPLRRVQLHDPAPAGLEAIRKPVFTPTFVLVDKGHEIGRIRGYPGEDFFWGLLGELFGKLDARSARAACSAIKTC